MKRYCLSLPSPIGELWLCQEDDALVGLSCAAPVDLALCRQEKTALFAEAERQLAAYFSGSLRQFDLPIAPKGTLFQQSVWQALQEIPYGQVCTYKEIAEKIGRPKAFRAVGQANHVNPLLIIQPCHRVVGSDGSLTGFACGMEIKRFLLDLEKQHI